MQLGKIKGTYRSSWQVGLDSTDNATSFGAADVEADSNGDPTTSLAGADIVAFGESNAIAVMPGGTANGGIFVMRMVLLFPCYSPDDAITGYRAWMAAGCVTTLGAKALGTVMAALGSMGKTAVIAKDISFTDYGGLGTNPYVSFEADELDEHSEIVVRSRGATHLMIHSQRATAATSFAFVRRLNDDSEGD